MDRKRPTISSSHVQVLEVHEGKPQELRRAQELGSGVRRAAQNQFAHNTKDSLLPWKNFHLAFSLTELLFWWKRLE